MTPREVREIYSFVSRAADWFGGLTPIPAPDLGNGHVRNVPRFDPRQTFNPEWLLQP